MINRVSFSKSSKDVSFRRNGYLRASISTFDCNSKDINELFYWESTSFLG